MIQRLAVRCFALVSLLFAVGCVAPVGASNLSVPKDGAEQCVSQCAVMGLGLGAVAIMANHVGCVCQPMGPARPQGANAVGPAGMATVLMLEEEEEHQRHARQSSSR